MNFEIVKKNWKYNFQNEKWDILSEVWFDYVYSFENDFAIVKKISLIFKFSEKIRNIVYKIDKLELSKKIFWYEWWIWSTFITIFFLLIFFSPFYFIIENILWISLPNSDYEVWFINTTISGILFIIYFYFILDFLYKLSKSYYFIDKNWNIINKKPFYDLESFNDYWVARIKEKTDFFKGNIKYWLINKNWQVITKELYDDIWEFKNFYTIIRKKSAHNIIWADWILVFDTFFYSLDELKDKLNDKIIEESKNNNHEIVIKLTSLWLELDNKNDHFYFLRALSFQWLSKNKKALFSIEKAIKITPKEKYYSIMENLKNSIWLAKTIIAKNKILLQSVLNNLNPEEIIYAEIAWAWAMWNSWWIMIYVHKKEYNKFICYEINIYENEEIYLKAERFFINHSNTENIENHNKILYFDIYYWGFWNLSFINKKVKLKIEDCFIYEFKNFRFKIYCSVLGVFNRVVEEIKSNNYKN